MYRGGGGGGGVMLNLVGNPEDWFSSIGAQVMSDCLQYPGHEAKSSFYFFTL